MLYLVGQQSISFEWSLNSALYQNGQQLGSNGNDSLGQLQHPVPRTDPIDCYQPTLHGTTNMYLTPIDGIPR